jgi:hypothetical protein
MSLLRVFKTVFLLVLVTAILWAWVGFVSGLKREGLNLNVNHTRVEEVSELWVPSAGGTSEDKGPDSDGLDSTEFPFDRFFEGLEGFIPG